MSILKGDLMLVKLLLLAGLLNLVGIAHAKSNRESQRLDDGWLTIAADSLTHQYNGFEKSDFETKNWSEVTVPHNWDRYEGFRRDMHGNRHGYAWYRRILTIDNIETGKQYSLFFEGVGSYATVWVNGQKVGTHAGGRTTFTIDISNALKEGENLLAVQADHPASIRDLPWVCGGCSPEWGFSEGSQPLGIFRPVSLITTSNVRIEPFGVHVWNDTTVTEKSAEVYVATELRNYSNKTRQIAIENALLKADGSIAAIMTNDVSVKAGDVVVKKGTLPVIENPTLWSIEHPYLYTMRTRIIENETIIDEVTDNYGIRWIKWDVKHLRGENATNRFYLNGKPVFINGTAEYEHLMGRSHAFTDEMVQSRVNQMKAAGYNAFRDAHQPHNLRYHPNWDKSGMLWWPQMAAHIWFDNPEFKANFKTLLRDFIKERRNSPSIILWGLENESTLPEAFAKECTEIFRQMDPTCSSQRLVTTCNGGSGTDWNVIQNWSGTYGGNPWKYDNDLSRQLLNGEYGAWRSTDFHSEGPYVQEAPNTEDRMTQLMELKVRLGEAAADSSCGQFHWLFASHENPGRTQSGEGTRDLDRVGPVNYKGLFTVWGEPNDAYYMFRSHYVDAKEQPMVYIASHTWPDRYTEPGIKSGIIIYSNCEEVELFNGIDTKSLGKKKHPEFGFHYIWDSVEITTNTLFAVGYENGIAVAKDIVVLHHLPAAQNLETLKPVVETITAPIEKQKYIYRVNCGGGDYTDSFNNIWLADRQWKNNDTWGSLSWTDDFDGLPPFYGSQRQTYDPISGTKAWPLLQSFRYGMDRLRYRFPLKNGKYNVELYFVEPWHGTGGGLECKNWRLFDVTINGETAVDDLDIWSEVGHDVALKKVVEAEVKNGMLEISFDDVKASQAVVSGIAISTKKRIKEVAEPAPGLVRELKVKDGQESWPMEYWLNTGDKQYADSEAAFSGLPAALYGAQWLQTPSEFADKDLKVSFIANQDLLVYIGKDHKSGFSWWLRGWNDAQSTVVSTQNGESKYAVFLKQFAKGDTVKLGENGKGNMYLVALQPAHTMDQSIDLRKTVTYQSEDGAVEGPTAMKTDTLKKPCVVLNTPNKDVMQWTFSVGLASKYGLQFRYMNMSGETMPALMEIISVDGTVQWKGDIEFPAADIKWKSKKTDTQTTINAGTYRLRITPKKKGTMYFDWVKVQ